jgi:hypothetical protein
VSLIEDTQTEKKWTKENKAEKTNNDLRNTTYGTKD